jgi:hypothetical protein
MNAKQQMRIVELQRRIKIAITALEAVRKSLEGASRPVQGTARY